MLLSASIAAGRCTPAEHVAPGFPVMHSTVLNVGQPFPKREERRYQESVPPGHGGCCHSS